MTRIVIALDKFKVSLPAVEVARAVRGGLLTYRSDRTSCACQSPAAATAP